MSGWKNYPVIRGILSETNFLNEDPEYPTSISWKVSQGFFDNGSCLPGEGWKNAAVSVPADATALRFKAVTGQVLNVEKGVLQVQGVFIWKQQGLDDKLCFLITMGKRVISPKIRKKWVVFGLPGKNGRLIFERWSNLIDGPLWRNFTGFPSKNSARSLDWCHSSWPLNYQSIFWRTPNSVKGSGHLVKTSEFTVSKTRQAEKIPNEKSCDSSEIFPYKPCHGTGPIRRIVGCRTGLSAKFQALL